MFSLYFRVYRKEFGTRKADSTIEYFWFEKTIPFVKSIR